jgi:hypothetical protein
MPMSRVRRRFSWQLGRPLLKRPIERVCRVHPVLAGAQAADHFEPVRAALRQQVPADLALHGERDPDVSGDPDVGACKALRCYAHDGERVSVHLHGPADDRGMGGKRPPPERLADHRDRVRARRPVVF